MNPFNLVAFAFGKMAFFSLLGLAALFVVPIVFGIAASLLPFAVVGVLVYLPWLLFHKHFLKNSDKRLPVLQLGPIVAPKPIIVPVFKKVKPLPTPGNRFSIIRALGELASGSIIGAVLGAMANWQSPGMVYSAMLGATFGAIAGFVVGFCDSESRPKVVEGEQA